MNSLYPNFLINEYIKRSNLKVNRKGYSITDIFRDYWEPFLRDNPHLNIRESVFENVERILKCQTPELGYHFYDCPSCDNFYISFNTCKSRFCNTCGVKYAETRSAFASKNLIDCYHRHITFTIPDSLWNYFREKRSRLNLLFEAVNQTLKYLLRKHGKLKDYQAGYILVLHTFGRALNFNCHIHCLISEGMIDKLGNFKHLKYFNYELLRKSFMKCILDLLHQDIGPSFYKEKCELYENNDQGFYVHAPNTKKDFKNQKELINYVLRYTGRPAMAQSRIINIINDFITYFYEPHQDDHLPDDERLGTVEVIEHVYDFIKKLIIHIPDKHFKMIRYYGLYSSKGKTRLPNYIKKTSFLRFKQSLNNLNWRNMLKSSFKYDILVCKCGYVMNYIRESSYFP